MRKIYYFFFILMISFSIHAQISITETYYDTPFIERQNRNTYAHLGEFIELFNYTTENIDISGWKLSDLTGSYYFPPGTIIESGDYLIVAYAATAGLNNNYFFDLFPNEESGNEDKVLYQNRILMNNKREKIRLSAHKLAGETLKQYYDISVVHWSCGGIPSALTPCNRNPIDPQTFGNQNSQTPYNTNYNYYVPSYQKLGDHELLFVSQNIETRVANATPFNLNFSPQLRDMDDISHVKDVLESNYYQLTNDQRVQEILDKICDINISVLNALSVSDTYIEDYCFTFDTAGNQENNFECPSDDEEEDSTDEIQESILNSDLTYNLEEIANRITIVPNPTSGLITMSWDNEISNIISQIVIVPMTGGSLVIPVSFSSGSNSATSNLSSQSAGFYVVRFTLDSGEVVTKTIIKI